MNNEKYGKFINALLDNFQNAGITRDRLEDIFFGSLNSADLASSLSEAFRVPAEEIISFLTSAGFGDIAARAKMEKFVSATGAGESGFGYRINSGALLPPLPELFQIEFGPGLDVPLAVPEPLAKSLSGLVDSIRGAAGKDSFFQMYRQGIMAYHDRFIESDAKLIDTYLEKSFKPGQLKYLISTGIGANEMHCHYMALINNRDANRRLTWFVFDSPLGLRQLPKEITPENTVFIESCRSGKTQETVKIHEFTSRLFKRIVLANSGPMFDLARRDNNLVLALADEVPARFSRNVTPILLAPLYVAGLDTREIWRTIEAAAEAFDPSRQDSLPFLMAQFIYLHQKQKQINFCYLGCSGDEAVLFSADELVQLWNEGVNKEGNDMLVSRFFGQPRDSHTVVEGLLANSKNKMAIFLTHNPAGLYPLPDLASATADSINPLHAGIKYGQDDFLLAQANYERFKQSMPVIKIELKGPLSYKHGVVLGQLWQDLAACYAKLLGIDAGSNPEVRAVRDRSEKILADQG